MRNAGKSRLHGILGSFVITGCADEEKDGERSIQGQSANHRQNFNRVRVTS